MMFRILKPTAPITITYVEALQESGATHEVKGPHSSHPCLETVVLWLHELLIGGGCSSHPGARAPSPY